MTMKYFNKHKKIILLLIVLSFIGLLFFGYSLTVTKDIKSLVPQQEVND